MCEECSVYVGGGVGEGVFKQFMECDTKTTENKHRERNTAAPTSPVPVAEVGEPPYVAQPHSVADAGEQELELPSPASSLGAQVRGPGPRPPVLFLTFVRPVLPVLHSRQLVQLALLTQTERKTITIRCL